jgi:hypothetical protein
MRKEFTIFLTIVICLFSCKKEEESTPPNTFRIRHAFIKGIVRDSATGSPLSHAGVYYISNRIDSTDINGFYTTEISWPEGIDGAKRHFTRPADSTRFTINARSITQQGAIQSTWGILIDNDTVSIGDILASPF